MTVRIVEIEDENGMIKWYAYHAHIVYHGDQESVDFDPEDNSTVEVMAELPHSSHLASLRAPGQMGIMGGVGDKALHISPRNQVIDVVCPDPKCGAVTSYPAVGDPEARAVHARYRDDVTGINHAMRLALDFSEEAHRMRLIEEVQPFVANAWARADLGLHPTANHDHLHVQHTGDRKKIVPPDHTDHKKLIKHAEKQRANGVVFGGKVTA